MYLLGLGLLVLSTWYLMKLYTNFNNDPIAKKEIDNAWQEAKKEISDAWAEAKKEAKGKNPFAPGRIRDALNSYEADMKKKEATKEDN